MFTLTLVTPEKKLLTDVEIEEIIVPAFRGELNILPGHAPLMSTLGIGLLRYRLKDSKKFESAAISWGYCEVNPRGINILAETAETQEEVDFDRVRLSLKASESKIKSGNLTENEIIKFQRKIKRARTRLQLEGK